MRIGMSLVLGAWILASAPAFAQPPPPPPPPVGPGPLTLPEGGVSGPLAGDPGPPLILPAPSPDAFRFWVRAEYLAWWVKSTPVPVSILTGDPNNPTQELLNTDRGFGMLSGFRVGVGAWLDSSNTLGFDANLFSLQQRTTTFGTSSDGMGNPTLVFPFNSQTPGAIGANQLTITSPGLFAGTVQVASSLQLWGLDTNADLVLLPRNSSGFQFTALAGFRYVDLLERLNITTFSSDIMTSPTTDLYQNDMFGTRNQFYGGQVGARANWQMERIGFDITGKLAMGVTHQSVDVQGVSSQTGPGGVNGVFPGGFFAQASNMGHQSANNFSVIPSIEMKFYIFFTQQLRGFVGYDFMYWTGVVRPGSQIDHNINLSQSAIYGSGSLMGSAYPTAQFNRTDFWAQGITFGLEFKF